MKQLETKNSALKLRKEGFSLKDISIKLNIAKSTASKWLKEIPLKDEQERKLSGRQKGTKVNSSRRENERKQYQLDAKKYLSDFEFIAGCSLYWAEGTKNINTVIFCNTDANMILFFKNFLMKFFKVKKNEILLTLNCYLTDVKQQKDIENYWLNLLSLERTSLRKGRFKICEKIGKYKYGICTLMLHRTDVVQTIFGGIQNYFGFENLDWLVKQRADSSNGKTPV